MWISTYEERIDWELLLLFRTCVVAKSILRWLFEKVLTFLASNTFWNPTRNVDDIQNFRIWFRNSFLFLFLFLFVFSETCLPFDVAFGVEQISGVLGRDGGDDDDEDDLHNFHFVASTWTISRRKMNCCGDYLLNKYFGFVCRWPFGCYLWTFVLNNKYFDVAFM